MKLDDMTWDEAVKLCKDKTILVPHGSTEEHGYHLPLKTDAFVAEKICAEFYDDKDVVVAPVMQYSFARSTKGFPGTITADIKGYETSLIDICNDLQKLKPKQIIFFLAHDGDMNRLILKKIPKIKVFGWKEINPKSFENKVFETEGNSFKHAADGETSLMLYLDPKSVKMNKAVDEKWPENYAEVGISKSGVNGFPSKATREKGKKLFEFYISELRKFISE